MRRYKPFLLLQHSGPEQSIHAEHLNTAAVLCQTALEADLCHRCHASVHRLLLRVMAQANATAAIEALSILARTLLTGGQPFQAIKCLEAVCRSSAQMPVAAAKTRLWVSRLLLQHTQNISEATQHLQQAVSIRPTCNPALLYILPACQSEPVMLVCVSCSNSYSNRSLHVLVSSVKC